MDSLSDTQNDYSQEDELSILSEEDYSKLDSTKSIIIFDYDDTLFATTTFTFNYSQYHVISPKLVELFKKLDISAYNLLAKAIKLGNVFVVSNAAREWVISSCKALMPKTYTLFNQLAILSCRDLYTTMLPNKENYWKIYVFSNILRDCSTVIKTEGLSVISIGDSINERNAIYSLSMEYEAIIPKSIKLVEFPSLDSLIQEQILIMSNLDYFVYKPTRIDQQLSYI